MIQCLIYEIYPKKSVFSCPSQREGELQVHTTWKTLVLHVWPRGHEEVGMRSGESTPKLEAYVHELRGKTMVKKGLSKKAAKVAAVESQKGNQGSSREKKQLSLHPLILMRGSLVRDHQDQTVNTLMWTKSRGSLPLARRRKGMTEYSRLSGFDGMAHWSQRGIRHW